MRSRLLVMMLVTAMGLTGCLSISNRGASAPPMTPPPPIVQPPMAQPAVPPAKPPSSPPPAAPAPTAITGSKLTVTLTSSQGNKAQLFLFAPDEQVVVADAASCIAQSGDRLRSGHYEFYLLAEPAEPVRQNLVLPGNEPLRFNDTRPKYLTVLPGEHGGAPDLLLLQQYSSCNGTFAFALALAPDGRQLIPYNFVSKQTSLTTGISSMEQLGPGKLRTTVYNNATGIYTTTTWEAREAEHALAATSVEETKHP